MHAHPEERLGRSEPGSVILELGEGTGALILLTPPELDGQEIEISPAGADAHDVRARTHSMVRERHTGSRTIHAAVYPDLAEGDYLVWRADGTVAGQVTIDGGAVTQFRWPQAR
jgi:hypothetical protein